MKRFFVDTLFTQKFCLIFTFCFFSFSLCQAMDVEEIEIQSSPLLKFKLGFEFQEGSGLCPWALKSTNIQKKELFSFKTEEENENVWHVVIDTSDIEFVTRPFSYQERKPLESCIASISKSFKILQELLDEQTEITFSVWINRLKSHFGDYLSEFPLFSDVKERPIIRPSHSWAPKFSPQVTIQHPLEYTIPLYFGLFGFSSRYMPDFSTSLPCRDLFLDAQKTAIRDEFEFFVNAYQQKVNGLVFLHALTLVQMTPDVDCTDSQLLEETYTHLTNFYQIDPKLKLTLMSRRPFSAMLKDIPTRGPYANFFMQVMIRNSAFYQIPRQFGRTNYAEQFFDSQTGEPKALLGFLPFFQGDFLTQNEDILIKLLEQGVVSTTMIRNFKEEFRVDDSFSGPDLLKKYFEESLKSVENPNKTYIIDSDNLSVRSVPFDYDQLSPPLFLEFENSMGRFKDEGLIDKSYGEAIIEVRGIRDVQAWFLRKCGLSLELTGSFLTQPGDNLKRQAIKLFDFLFNFGTEIDRTEIFYLGIPSALRTY
jgi:hypothetical protein